MARKRNKRRAKRKERRARAKKKKFMRKIIRDGKISKKEGRKAAKRGISLRSIRNRNIRDTVDQLRIMINSKITETIADFLVGDLHMNHF